MSGTVGILNVGAGDTKLTFDKDNPAECIRAARIVTDMLRRGYALLVDVGEGKYRRVTQFDEAKFEYIIADFDPIVAAVDVGQSPQPPKEENGPVESAPEKRKPGKRAIAATGANAVAVARTAGG